MAALVFDLDKISYTYPGEISGLAEVSFSVARGECWAILGANGSGKSTLLKLLDGLTFPSRGKITAFGEELSERRFGDDAFNFAFRKRVGFVFQNPDVQLFNASVLDEVAFAPLQLRLGQAEVNARTQLALEALNISKLAERPPHHLSGGEKKRVALASVLSLQPEVWLLDEPTAGLDPRSQAWLVDFISLRHASGETIVIATHDLAIIQRVATHCLVLSEDHQVAATGIPSIILANHSLLHACNLIHEHTPPGNAAV